MADKVQSFSSLNSRAYAGARDDGCLINKSQRRFAESLETGVKERRGRFEGEGERVGFRDNDGKERGYDTCSCWVRRKSDGNPVAVMPLLAFACRQL